jgi:hypothetical protein
MSTLGILAGSVMIRRLEPAIAAESRERATLSDMVTTIEPPCV